MPLMTRMHAAGPAVGASRPYSCSSSSQLIWMTRKLCSSPAVCLPWGQQLYRCHVRHPCDVDWSGSRCLRTAATSQARSPSPASGAPSSSQPPKVVRFTRAEMARRSRSGMGASPSRHHTGSPAPGAISIPPPQQQPQQQQPRPPPLPTAAVPSSPIANSTQASPQSNSTGPSVRRRGASGQPSRSTPTTHHTHMGAPSRPAAAQVFAPATTDASASNSPTFHNSTSPTFHNSTSPSFHNSTSTSFHNSSSCATTSSAPPAPGPPPRRRSPAFHAHTTPPSHSSSQPDPHSTPRQGSPMHVLPAHQQHQSQPVASISLGSAGGVQGRVGLSPPLLTATDKLHHQITDPVNALTSVQAIMEFKNIRHSTLLSQLLTLYQEKRLSKEQLAQLYALTHEHAEQGTGLSLEQVQSGLASLAPGLRGKAKRCEAVLGWLTATYESAVAVQEQRHPGITAMQVELVHALHSVESTTMKRRVTNSPVAADSGSLTLTPDDWALPGMELLRPATATKVKAFLQGKSVAEIMQLVKRKHGIKETTVQQALIDALKAGVVLPEDRLLQEFRLTGGDDQLSYEDVSKAVAKLLPQQQDAPGLTWYFKVRSELTAQESVTHDLVTRQEAAIDEQQGKEGAGTGFTVMQIRVVAYLMRQRQQHSGQQLIAGAQDAGSQGVEGGLDQEGHAELQLPPPQPRRHNALRRA